MSRQSRVTRLGRADLARLPECPAECVGRLMAEGTWIDHAVERFGAVGVQLVDHDVPHGQILFTPAESLPAQGMWQATVLSTDSAVIINAHDVDHGRRDQHQLVQAMAALLVHAGVPAIEVIGSYRDPSCAMPAVGWLQQAGFVISRDHPLTPRLRLELTSTVRLPQFRSMWATLTDLVRPNPPEPAGRAEQASWAEQAPLGH